MSVAKLASKGGCITNSVFQTTAVEAVKRPPLDIRGSFGNSNLTSTGCSCVWRWYSLAGFRFNLAEFISVEVVKAQDIRDGTGCVTG